MIRADRWYVKIVESPPPAPSAHSNLIFQLNIDFVSLRIRQLT